LGIASKALEEDCAVAYPYLCEERLRNPIGTIENPLKPGFTLIKKKVNFKDAENYCKKRGG
jgi:hypothetical protein